MKNSLRLKRAKKRLMRKRLKKRVAKLMTRIDLMERKMAQPIKVKTFVPRRKAEFIQADIDMTGEPRISVAEEGKREMAKVIADRKAPVPSFNALLHLFNVKNIDKVYKQPNGNYVPATKKYPATHTLVPTLWNDPDEVKEMESAIRPKFLSAKWEPVALSVCAIPIKRKLLKGKLPLKHPLPKSSTRWPVYRVDMSLGMKRITLKEYAAVTGCWRKMRRKIDRMMHHECDHLLKEFVMGSRWLREKIKQDPKNIAYWAERKLALAKAAEEKKKEKAKQVAQGAPRKKTLFDHFDDQTKQIIAHAMTETLKFNQLRK